MASNVLSPSPWQKFWDNNGEPLANGLLFTYISGTNTKLGTFKTAAGTANSNPINLNARGECDLWIPPNVAYTYVLAPAGDTDPPTNPIKTVDNVIASQITTLYGGVDGGSVNAYTLSFSANFSSYIDGTVIYWIPAHTNTGPSTINVNGIGVVNITYPDGTALFGGELVANQMAQIIYQTPGFGLISVAQINGSFAPAWFGFSVAPTGNMLWQKTGSQVTLKWTGTTGTSNATSMGIGNVPFQIRPTGASLLGMLPTIVIDNGNRVQGSFGFGGLSTFQFNMGSPLSGTGFNAGAVTKGLDAGWTATYFK